MSASQVVGRFEQVEFQGLFEGVGGFAMMDVGGELVPKCRSVEGERAVTNGFGSSAWDGKDSAVHGGA